MSDADFMKTLADMDGQYLEELSIDDDADISQLQIKFSENSMKYLDESIRIMHETANDDFDKLLAEQESLLAMLTGRSSNE